MILSTRSHTETMGYLNTEGSASSFVPTKIPRRRRLQTMAVAACSTLLVNSIFLFLILWCEAVSHINVWLTSCALKFDSSALAVPRYLCRMDALDR